MQRSPNAITQAGNLYMFVMHNPVRWIDPSGLFAIPGLLIGPMSIFGPTSPVSILTSGTPNISVPMIVLLGGKGTCPANQKLTGGGGGKGGAPGINLGPNPSREAINHVRNPQPPLRKPAPAPTQTSAPTAATQARPATVVTQAPPVASSTTTAPAHPRVTPPATQASAQPRAATTTPQASAQQINLGNVNANNLPQGWTSTTNNGFTHIRDAQGTIRVRIDPPDRVTDFTHRHHFDASGRPLDAFGNVVDRRSPLAHILIPD